jgi:DNA-binding transcriptional ArsR family regulator
LTILIIENIIIIEIREREAGTEETRLDLVLHPVRIRIVMALAGSQLSPAELADELGDVPLATLYRHLNRLVEAGILQVVAERKVRNATERIYTLKSGAAFVGQDEAGVYSRDEHLRYFVSYLLSLLDDYARFIQMARLPEDLERVGFQKIPLNLSPEEFQQLARQLNESIRPYLLQEPNENRQRQLLAFTTIPLAATSPSSDQEA